MVDEISASSLNTELTNIFNKAREYRVADSNELHSKIYLDRINDMIAYWNEELKETSDAKLLALLSQDIKKAIDIEQCQYSVTRSPNARKGCRFTGESGRFWRR